MARRYFSERKLAASDTGSSAFHMEGPRISPPGIARCGTQGCAHRFNSHRYLYTVHNIDRYRCGVEGCRCGAQYEIRGVQLPEDATEKEALAAMRALSAGGGEVIDPARLK